MLLRISYQCIGFLVMVCFFSGHVKGQIVYTKSFTETLQAAHLDYYKPLEQWFHVSALRKDSYLDYDLVLLNETEEIEIRYVVKEYQDDVFDQFPDIDRMRIVNHMATNDEEADIRVTNIGPSEVEERYNAEHGTIHYFSPKKSFSSKPFAAMISLYSKGKSTIYAIILYEDDTYEPLKEFHQIRFRE